MLNPIFWKKVQGQKHPGRWGIVEHQIPSIKVLFKTNAKSHKHPGIKPLSSESKTQLVNQIKQNSYRNIEIAYIYTYIHIYIYCHRASGREQRSSGGNTSSNPQVSAPVPRPVVNPHPVMSSNLHGPPAGPRSPGTMIFKCVEFLVQLKNKNSSYWLSHITTALNCKICLIF